MTDTSRDDRVNAWHLEMLGKLDALRAQWAAEAQAQSARPLKARRTAASPRRRRTAGPLDAAEQARQAEQARRLDQERQEWLLAMERSAMEVALIGW